MSKLTPYQPPPPIRSALLKHPPEGVPPTDELEALQAELTQLRTRSLERAKKAGEDLRSIEESMRRIKEREKGKLRAAEKLRRERGSLDTDEPDYSLANSGHTKSRAPSIPLSVANSARSSQDPRKPLLDDSKKNKKKKRPREEVSDAESDLSAVKTVPNRPHIIPPFPKPAKPLPSITNNAKTSFQPDFSVPPPISLLTPRPPIPPPPVAGPSKPTEVTEDFSKLKQPSQVLVSTFYTSIEPWIRPIREEDLGFLEFTADEVEPFVVPPLGKHYSEQWEEADIAAYGGPMPGFQPSVMRSGQGASGSGTGGGEGAGGLTAGGEGASASGSGGGGAHPPPPPPVKWDPSTLGESDLLAEERAHGPLTERLVSALLQVNDPSGWKGVKAAEDAMEGRPGGTGAAASKREKVNVADLEERIQDTMRFHGLLKEPPDYTQKVDDPIATALRHMQRELRGVVALNKARKARLAEIVKDRLGYNEYLDYRDVLDRGISTLYARSQKKEGPKAPKKRKKGDPNGVSSSAASSSSANNGAGNGSGNGGGSGAGTGVGMLAPSPAALGLGPDEDNALVVPEPLRGLVETRRQWVGQMGGIFEAKQRECPGRVYGLPKRSVFEGVQEEVERELSGGVGMSIDGGGDGGGDALVGGGGLAGLLAPTRRENGVSGDQMDVG